MRRLPREREHRTLVERVGQGSDAVHRGTVERRDDTVGAAQREPLLSGGEHLSHLRLGAAQRRKVADEAGRVTVVPLPAAIDHRSAAGDVTAVDGSQKRGVLHLLEERRAAL